MNGLPGTSWPAEAPKFLASLHGHLNVLVEKSKEKEKDMMRSDEPLFQCLECIMVFPDVVIDWH